MHANVYDIKAQGRFLHPNVTTLNNINKILLAAENTTREQGSLETSVFQCPGMTIMQSV